MDWLQRLRNLHFPPALNVVPAHLSLFHSLSSVQVLRLKEHWHRFEQIVPLDIRFTAPRSLGRGTAIVADAPRLSAIRSSLMEVMGGCFSPQDKQPFRAHVTIQNKVDLSAAKSLVEQLCSDFVVRHGMGLGVTVWKYLGGPWRHTDTFSFDGALLAVNDE